MENNVGEEEQKLYRRFRKDNGPLTVQLFFLKIDTEGDKTRGAGDVVQYFRTRSENAPLLGPCSDV